MTDSPRKFYPIFLDITGRRAVVVGGGPVAARKAGSLAEAGADVTIISPELSAEMSTLVSEGRALHIARVYQKGDLAGAAVVIAATDDPSVNEAVCAEAKEAGALANSVRPPGAGDFVVPSTIRRGGLTVAVSTSGGCPALTKKLRRDLEAFLGDEYGAFLEFLEEARAIIKESVPDEGARQAILTRLVESGLAESFKTEGPDAARNAGRDMLAKLIKGGA